MFRLSLASLFEPRTVRFYGDFIDPFCYIGFHQLRQAAEPLRFSIRWCGFELNPETPEDGFRFETAQNADFRGGMWASVAGYAQQSGIPLSDPGFAPNTRLAHLLVGNGGILRDVKNPLIERVYQAYLSGHKNIGDRAVLIELASGFGVSQTMCESAWNQPNTLGLEKNRQDAVKLQFLGMPGFWFRGKTYFGALRSQEWQKILTQH